jgi:hypothetical protein
MPEPMLRTLPNLFPRARKARKPAEMAMAVTPRLFLRSTPRQWKIGILLSWTTGKMNIKFLSKLNVMQQLPNMASEIYAIITSSQLLYLGTWLQY